MSAHNDQLKSEQLLQISDEVSRIASTLAQLSTAGEACQPVGLEGTQVPDVPVATLRAVIQARRLRSKFFDADLFADPAWDMMLDLLEAELSHRRVSVTALCIAASIPPTTAIRWIKTLTDKGLFVRRDDQLDGRRTYVSLSPQTSAALRHYFQAIDHPSVI